MTMLGTGNALATEVYNTCFVLSEGKRHLLVDGGGGSTVLHQLKVAGIDWMGVREIFVTHKHIDHLLGVVWMVRMICQFMEHGEYEGEATIYSHAEVLGLIRELAEKLLPAKDTRHLGERLRLVEVHDGEASTLIGRPVTFFDIGSTKATQYGFSLDIGDGRRLTCCGDEPCSRRGEPYARDSAWLLHEAFCLYSQRDVFDPYEKHHSTVKDACELAERLGVENLLLYHTEDRTLPDRRRLYVEEGSQYFRGRIWVPDDLETIECA